MSKTFKDSEIEKDVIIKQVQNSELMMCHEIEILEALAKKYNFMNLADAAKQSGKSYNGIKKRVNAGKEVVLNLNGNQLISIN